jgi:hypothetical protein
VVIRRKAAKLVMDSTLTTTQFNYHPRNRANGFGRLPSCELGAVVLSKEETALLPLHTWAGYQCGLNKLPVTRRP